MKDPVLLKLIKLWWNIDSSCYKNFVDRTVSTSTIFTVLQLSWPLLSTILIPITKRRSTKGWTGSKMLLVHKYFTLYLFFVCTIIFFFSPWSGGHKGFGQTSMLSLWTKNFLGCKVRDRSGNFLRGPPSRPLVIKIVYGVHSEYYSVRILCYDSLSSF